MVTRETCGSREDFMEVQSLIEEKLNTLKMWDKYKKSFPSWRDDKKRQGTVNLRTIWSKLGTEQTGDPVLNLCAFPECLSQLSADI